MIERHPFLVFFGLPTVGLIALILFVDWNWARANCSDSDRIILSVGGCDKYGYCGVLYSDGTAGNARYPVAGTSGPKCSN